MFKLIGKYEEVDGKEYEDFGDARKELGLIGSLSGDVGDVEIYYDDNGGCYVVAKHSEFYYGTKDLKEECTNV